MIKVNPYVEDLLSTLGSFPDVACRIMTVAGKQSNVDEKLYEYDVAGIRWTVVEGEFFKYTFSSNHEYHCFFDKSNGFNVRFGRTPDEDPEMCGLGPEIADIEVVTGSCPKVNSENCRWCYKNNTSAPGKTMTLSQFQTVVKSFPRNLSQVALGITGVKSNPELVDMLKWLREYGIVGNLTLTGADLDDEMAENLARYCGACAVSCYDKAKDLCYSTIKKLHNTAMEKFSRDMHVNMHIVIADFSMDHVMSVLNDVKDGKVEGLSSIVMLHAKPVGRAKNMDCSLSKANLKKVVEFCLANDISFGFDSCNGFNVQDILSDIGRKDLHSSIEPCESAHMSIYLNVDGRMTPCSFVEHVYGGSSIDMLNVDQRDFTGIWNGSDMLNGFRKCSRCSKSCPAYRLDCV